VVFHRNRSAMRGGDPRGGSIDPSAASSDVSVSATMADARDRESTLHEATSASSRSTDIRR
jgi:hypothetical protein